MQSLDHPNIIRLYGVVLTQPLKMVRYIYAYISFLKVLHPFYIVQLQLQYFGINKVLLFYSEAKKGGGFSSGAWLTCSLCPSSGDGVGPSGFTVRHPALASVWVPPPAPLAVCSTGGFWDGLPGEPQIDPPRPGSQERAASVQGDGKDRRLWPDEGAQPGDGPLHYVGAQKDPVCMVRHPEEVEMHEFEFVCFIYLFLLRDRESIQVGCISNSLILMYECAESPAPGEREHVRLGFPPEQS